MTAADNAPIPLWPFLGTAIAFFLACLVALYVAKLWEAARYRAAQDYDAKTGTCEACGRPTHREHLTLRETPGGVRSVCGSCATKATR